MKKDFVIVGGGLAGLSAAIRLTELGAAPLVIEGGEYPCHKVCGEFFSPTSLPILHQWGIHPIEIPSTRFHVGNKTLNFTFPTPAGGGSHLLIDPKLAEIAMANGAEIKTKTSVVKLRFEGNCHEIELSSGEIVQAKSLILAVGRLPQNTQENVSSPAMPYVGIKAHFEGIFLNNTLEMFAFKGGYLGLSPIENNRCNAACLASSALFNRGQSTDAFIQELMSTNPLLKFYLSTGKCLFTEWMRIPVPQFGVRKTPNWPNAYFIGDAAGSIPPITGNGLSLAIRGGILAAECALKMDFLGFKARWKKEFSSQIYCGKILHQASLHPFLLQQIMALGNVFPSFKQSIYRLTH